MIGCWYVWYCYVCVMENIYCVYACLDLKHMVTLCIKKCSTDTFCPIMLTRRTCFQTLEDDCGRKWKKNRLLKTHKWHNISHHNFNLFCYRVTPSDGDTSPSGADESTGATGGAGAMAISATSTLSLPMSQGKPSLRRIKGRIHRSKSLDSIDLLDSNVRLTHGLIRPTSLL